MPLSEEFVSENLKCGVLAAFESMLGKPVRYQNNIYLYVRNSLSYRTEFALAEPEITCEYSDRGSRNFRVLLRFASRIFPEGEKSVSDSIEPLVLEVPEDEIRLCISETEIRNLIRDKVSSFNWSVYICDYF